MSRNKKLYLSELIQLNKNEEMSVIIRSKEGILSYNSTQETKEKLCNSIYWSKLVKEWYITHTKYTQTLHITLK